VIKRIDLETFKCFKKLSLPVNALTLLSGTNASGKSSILQAIVLLHQTMVEHEWSNRLQLNGSEIQLGTVSDIVNQVYGRYEFSIGVKDDSSIVQWNFSYQKEMDVMSASIDSVSINEGIVSSPQKLHYLFPEPLEVSKSLSSCLRRLTYLTAERVGPRESYPLQDSSFTQVVGARGENAVGLLQQRSNEPVQSAIIDHGVAPTLFKQVEAKMDLFFPGTKLNLEKVNQTNSAILGLRTSDATKFHRPVNVGFGLTQVLPIVVAALSAREGDLLLIENPEVHLHPAGQSLMGTFLSEVAAAGIQVIIESHSDHILNGIRRAVKSEKLAADLVSLHVFRWRRARKTGPLRQLTGE